MRILATYFMTALLLLVGLSQAPYLKISPPFYYVDQPTLIFLFLIGLGCCFLWRRQDFKTLAQLLMGKNLSDHAAQTLLISLQKSWGILAYGGLLLGLMSLVSVLYDISDMRRLGSSLALSILCPLYLVVLRWWVVSPLMQKLKKVPLIDESTQLIV